MGGREKKRVEERERETERRIVRGSIVRKEIWKSPGEDGGRRLHRTTYVRSGREISTRGSSTPSSTYTGDQNYLLTINFNLSTFPGKLSIQINTEDFSAAQGSLLDQFRVLFKSALPLVQIMALNMYIIEETKLS